MPKRLRNWPGIGNVPPNVDPQLRTFLQGVQEALQVSGGQRGDPLDRSPSLRELVEIGLVESSQISRTGSVRPPDEVAETSAPPEPPENVTFTANTSADPSDTTNTLSSVLVTWSLVSGTGGATTATEVYMLAPDPLSEPDENGIMRVDPTISIDDLLAAGTPPKKVVSTTMAQLILDPAHEYKFWLRNLGAGTETAFHDSFGTLVVTPRSINEIANGINDRLDVLDEDLDAQFFLRIEAPDTEGGAPRIAGIRGGLAGDESLLQFIADNLAIRTEAGDNIMSYVSSGEYAGKVLFDNIVVSGSAIVDAARVQGELIAGNLTVTGTGFELDQPVFTTPSISGGKMKGTQLMLGTGPYGPPGDKTAAVYLSTDGAAYFDSTLEAMGDTTIGGSTTIAGTTDIGGNTTIGGNFTIEGDSTSDYLFMDSTRLEIYAGGVRRVRLGIY